MWTAYLNGTDPSILDLSYQENYAMYAVNTWGWQGIDYWYNGSIWVQWASYPQPPILNPANTWLTNRLLYPVEVAGVMNANTQSSKYTCVPWSNASAAVESEAWYIAKLAQPSAVLTLSPASPHWMLVVGCTANMIPDDNMATIYGVWAQDPYTFFSSKPSYVSSDIWAAKYFTQWGGWTYTPAPPPPADYTYGCWPTSLYDVEDPVPGDGHPNAGPSGQLTPPTKAHGYVSSPDQALAIADEGIKLHMLSITGPIASHLKGAKQGQPVYVTALDDSFGDYYMIPYTRNGKISAAVTVDVQTGEFEGASACTADLTTMPGIDQTSAGATVQSARGTAAADITLMWGFCEEATSPYTPFWRVNGQDGNTYYVTQDGRVHDKLTGRP
jgi:hypothetical protein